MRALFKLLVCSLVIYLASAATQQHPKLFRPPSALAQHGVSEIPHRWLLQLRGEPCLSGRSKQQVYDEQDSLLQELRSRNISFTLHSRTTMLMNIVDLEVHQIHLERVLNLDHIIHANPVVISPNQHVKDRDHKLASLRKRSLLESFKEKAKKVFKKVANVAKALGQITKIAKAATKNRGNSTVHLVKSVAALHRQELFGSGIKIGIIDSGVNLNHAAFGGNCWGKPNCPHQYGRDFTGEAGNDCHNPRGQSFVDETSQYSWQRDYMGHGTIVAVLLGGKNEKYIGVAPDAIFGHYKVTLCSGEIINSAMVTAMDQAIEDGMDIINFSMGDPMPWEGELIALSISKAAKKKGVHIISAAGNKRDLWSLYTPSVSPESLSVALTYSDYSTTRRLFIGKYYAPFKFDELQPPPTGQKFPMVAIRLSDLLEIQSINFMTLEQKLTSNKSVVIIDSQASTNEQILRVINLLPKPSRIRAVLIISDTFTIEDYVLSSLINVTPVAIVLSKYGKNILSRSTSNKIVFGTEEKLYSYQDVSNAGPNSAFGPTGDFNIKPDISAYGTNIIIPGYDGTTVETYEGTSVAAPFVSGCVAILLQHRRQRRLSISPAITRTLLQNHALPGAASVNGKREMFTAAGQGSGAIRIGRSVNTTVRVEPSVIALSSTNNQHVTQVDGFFSTSLTLHNDGAAPVMYHVTNVPAFSLMANSTKCGPSKQSVSRCSVFIGPSTDIIVPAGSSLELSIAIKPNEDEVNRGFVFSGYMRFTPIAPPTESTEDDLHPTVVVAGALHVPYLGYNGDINLWNPLDANPGMALASSTGLSSRLEIFTWVKQKSISRMVECLKFEIKTIRPVLLFYLMVFDENDNVIGYITRMTYMRAFEEDPRPPGITTKCISSAQKTYLWRWQVKLFTEENVSNTGNEDDAAERVPLESNTVYRIRAIAYVNSWPTLSQVVSEWSNAVGQARYPDVIFID